MDNTHVILLSDEGKISKAIIELLPRQYIVRTVHFNTTKSNVFDNIGNINFSNNNVIIVNLSEIKGRADHLLSSLKSLYQNTPLIVLHLYNQKIFANAFLKMGAMAYLPVNFQNEELILAIESVLSKDVFISTTVY